MFSAGTQYIVDFQSYRVSRGHRCSRLVRRHIGKKIRQAHLVDVQQPQQAFQGEVVALLVATVPDAGQFVVKRERFVGGLAFVQPQLLKLLGNLL